MISVREQFCDGAEVVVHLGLVDDSLTAADEEWGMMNSRRVELILKEISTELAPEESAELFNTLASCGGEVQRTFRPAKARLVPHHRAASRSDYPPISQTLDRFALQAAIRDPKQSKSVASNDSVAAS
ncbi:MAG: hypothetical protein O3A00_00250 [Planctomycetota bacterium]|nr:hypothetical protein [Planctomycetota bacterium]